MKQGVADIRIEHDDTRRIADVTEIVNDVTWSGDVNEAYRTLTVSLTNTIDGRNRRINFQNGDMVRFYNRGEELFRGRIFSFSISHDGTETFTAYDTNVYFTKSQTTRTFRNRKASGIVRQLASEFGIRIGNIEDTGFVIPKLVAEEEMLYDIIKQALAITEKQTGRKFRLSNRQGLVYLEDQRRQIVRDIIENGVNILSAEYSQSVEDLRNRLVMIGGPDGQYREVRVNQELIRRFGLMQAVETYSGNEVSASEVKQAADERFAELTTIDDSAMVSCLGNHEVTAGKSIYVIERMTGILGGYYVTSDTHTFSGGMHEMSLSITAAPDLPKLVIEGGSA